MATIDETLARARHLHELGNLTQAAELYEQILLLKPDHAQACSGMGGILFARGQLEEAAARFQQALQLQPDLVEAHNNLGEVFVHQGKVNEALACFHNAVSIQPNEGILHYNLGKTLEALERSTEAIASYREAIRLQPDFALAHTRLALLLTAQGEFNEALICFQHAVRLQPREAGAHNNLGNALLEAGRKDEATAHFQEALRIDPNCMGALARVALTGLFRLSPEQTGRIKTLLARRDLPAEDATMLHFAYAHLRDRASVYNEAFNHFRQGNALRHRFLHETGKAFDPLDHRRWIDQSLQTFSAGYFRQVEGVGLDTEVPLFIVGMPRSGTTLVEQILSLHALVFGAGELQDVKRLVDALPARLKSSESFPACFADVDRQTIRDLAQEHLHRLMALGGTALRVVDKTPLNFLYLGLIAALFPKARVIHCRRDPMDTCMSCYFQFFAGMNFAWDLADMGAYYRQYERLMAHWNAVLPLRMLEVSYEELVSNLEAVSRRMIEFCGLDWDERCLEFHVNPRGVHTVSTLQVRRPIYTTSVGRWKRYEKYLQPLVAALRHVPGDTSKPK